MSSNFTNYSVDAISSLINQNRPLELLTKQALIKAFRAATGQFKILADTSNNTTVLTPETEFSFLLSGGRNYIIQGDFIFLVGGAAGPVGGLKVQFNLPNHGANNYFSEGIVTTTVHATAPTIVGLGYNANLPVSGDVQGFNTPLTLAAATTANVFVQVNMQSILTPTTDDVLTISFAQVSTAAANPAILQRGSSMQCLSLSGSRRAPNVV